MNGHLSFGLAFVTAAALFGQRAPAPEPTPVTGPVNSTMPSWLQFSAEERARMEYIEGQNFKSIGDLYVLNRVRLNAMVAPARWLKFIVEAQDSRVFGQNTLPAPASQKNAADLRLGFVQLGGEEEFAILRLGRQSLDFGEGRFLADPNWSNVGRSFDAVRLVLTQGRLKIDLFSGRSVKVNPIEFDQATPAERFHGVYGALKGLPGSSKVEPYLLWRLEHSYKNERGTFGNLDERTLGLRWTGKFLTRFDYSAELARQTGSWAGDSIRAWSGHWSLGRAFPLLFSPRVFAEYHWASGDQNPKDGAHGTFDTLFPASHDKYGLTDLFCSSNLAFFRAGLQLQARKTLTVTTAYSRVRLANPADALYVSGGLSVRTPGAAAGVDIGQEADAQALWKVSGATQINAGYAHLFPGQFLVRTTSGVPYHIVFLNIVQRL